MSSLKDAAAARREKRRYQQVVNEAHHKDDDAIEHLHKLQAMQRSASKEQDPKDLVKQQPIKFSVGASAKVTPMMMLATGSKTQDTEDEFSKQKLLDSDGDKNNEQSKRPSVNLYATENLITFIDFFQQLGVLWALSLLVEWPPRFLLTTSWTLAFNLDGALAYFFYHKKTFLQDPVDGKADPHFSAWGELRNVYLWYAFGWMMMGLILIGLVAWMWTHDWFCGTLDHEKKQQVAKNHMRHSLFWLSYILGVPLLVALLRTFVCVKPLAPDSTAELVMAFDLAQECWDSFHLVAVVANGIIAAAFIVGVFFSFYHMVAPHTVYHHRDNHERYILQKECEYMLGINSEYVVFHYAFFFSFHREFVHFRLARMVEKILLVLAYLFLPQTVTQTVGFWGITMVFALFYTFARPFRAPASNAVMLICQYTVCIDALLLAAKGTNFEGEALLSSRLSVLLWVVNSLGFVLALGVFLGAGVYSGFAPLVVDPMEQPRVHGGDDVRRWVAVIKACNKSIKENSLRPFEFLVITPLENHLKEVAECFKEAELADHILQLTLLDTAQEAEYFLEQVREKSLLPNETLEEALVGTRPLLDRVDETTALIPPVRKRFIKNLQALRLFRIGYHGPHSDSDSDDDDLAQVDTDVKFDLDETVDATHRALIPPMDKDVLFELKAKWRGFIQRWKANFLSKKGRMPTADDMWVISAERKNYAMVSSAYQQHSARR